MCVLLKQGCVLLITCLGLTSSLIANELKPQAFDSVVYINSVYVPTDDKAYSSPTSMKAGAAFDWGQNESELLPHRATYAISLKKAYDTDIYDVEGTMVSELRDDGEAWIAEQSIRLTIKYRNSEDESEYSEDVQIATASRETKDGLRYSFYSQIKHPNQTLEGSIDTSSEIIQGEALKPTLEGEGTVTYLQPLGVPELHLPQGTLFPLTHAAYLLKKAKNSPVCSYLVFDGTNEARETVRVNTVITPTAPKIKFSDKVPFAADHGWLMHMAVYGIEPEGDDPDPDHQFEQRVLPHGILASQILNFEEEFDAEATLTALEFFTSKGASKSIAQLDR